MGKCKRSAARALEWLVDQGVEVAAVVASEPDPWTRAEQRLDLVAARRALPLVSDEELNAAPPEDVDLVISFLFWKRIREPLLSLGRIGCLNFHPAPLPDLRGLGGYNVAILEGLPDWGESLRVVRPGDDLERKLRAFWYPPHPGAVLEVDGRRLTLVDERLLAEVAEAYRDAGRIP
jgi:methionyl-tRNA formyltransferase